MIHRNIAQLALDEVVFENRNQVYGAFEIRQVYNSHLIKSLGIMLFIIFSTGVGVSTFNYFKSKYVNDIADIQPKEGVIVELLDIKTSSFPAVKLEIPKVIPQVKSVVPNTNYKVVDSPLETPQPLGTTMNLDQNSHTSDIVATGTSDSNEGIVSENPIPAETETIPEIPSFVEIMPKFENLSKYLANNINYPSNMMNLGLTGKVYIEFVVDKNGKVTFSRILKSSGQEEFDNEALRIISNMPNWTPGVHNGKQVSVKMIQAINFKFQ